MYSIVYGNGSRGCDTLFFPGIDCSTISSRRYVRTPPHVVSRLRRNLEVRTIRTPVVNTGTPPKILAYDKVHLYAHRASLARFSPADGRRDAKTSSANGLCDYKTARGATRHSTHDPNHPTRARSRVCPPIRPRTHSRIVNGRSVIVSHGTAGNPINVHGENTPSRLLAASAGLRFRRILANNAGTTTNGR